MVDLTGRGRMDVLRADGGFRHWLNMPDGSYQDRGLSTQIPGLAFTNSEWTFADLNGDGLVEIVRVRNGRIEYFLNRAAGHRTGGLFETTPIVMDNSQALRQGVTNWDPERLLFVDIDGNGYDDAVYLYPDRILYWINRGGWGWSDTREILLTENGAPILVTTQRASVRVGDLRGTGTAGLLWTGANQPMRYLDIAGGRKPLLLTEIENGIGGRVELEYGTTTQASGREWTTRVPFGIHVVRRVTRTDTVTGLQQEVRYAYFDGNYDRERREFIGFGEAEVTEVGDEGTANAACATRITRTRFHTGATHVTTAEAKIQGRATAGLPYWRAVSGPDTNLPEVITEWLYDTDVTPDFDVRGVRVYGTNGLSARDAAGNLVAEPSGLALQSHELKLRYDVSGGPTGSNRSHAVGGSLAVQRFRDSLGNLDPFGRVLTSKEAQDLAVRSAPQGREVSLLTIDATAPALTVSSAPTAVHIAALPERIKESELTYATQISSHTVLPLARILTRSAGVVVEDLRRYYDGQAYIGLPLGRVTAGNLSREEALVLRDDQLTTAYSDWPGGPPDLLALGYHRGTYGTLRSSLRPGGLTGMIARRPPVALQVPILVREPIYNRQLIDLLTRALTRPEGYGYFVNVRRFRYDLLPSGAPAYGMVSAYKDPLGFESTFQSDPFFLQHQSQTDAAGNTHTGTIDYRVSKLRRIVDPNGHASEDVYDAVGRIAAVIKPGDSAAQPSLVFEYWAPGHALPSFVRTSLREEAGQQGTFDSTVYYDGWGRSLQTRVEAEGGQFTVSGARNYNVRGGVLDRFVPYFAATDAYGNPPANGLTFRRSIDAQDRELRVVHPDGSATERQYAGLAEEEFDREDLRTGSPHAGTPTRTVRDMQGRLLEVHQRLAGSTVLARYSYDVFGNLTAFRLSGSASGPAVQDLAYCHDREGNLVVKLDRVAEVARVYTYDALYRLTEAEEINVQGVALPTECDALQASLALQAGAILGYAYSPEGDLQTFAGYGVTYTPVAGRPHGEITVNGRVYRFDVGGALEEVTTAAAAPVTLARLQWDGEGRLLRVEQPEDDRAIEIAYDYEGERLMRRMTRISDGQLLSETRYLGRWVSFHRDANVPNWQGMRQYVFDENRRLAVLDGTGAIESFVHPDHLGSADLVSDGAGTPICTLRYDPFGQELTPANCPTLRHRFNGKEADAETGLVHFGARDYLPEIGRWTALDPLLWTEPQRHLANPQGLNGYAYALNNPVTLIDPVGKSPGKYAGQYVDTGRRIVRFQRQDDGNAVAVTYRVVEAVPSTWLSKVTYDFGWSDFYSKEQGYGAYDRTVVFPLNQDLLTFDPDRIEPGRQFAVREVPSRSDLFFESQNVTGKLPRNASKDWSFRVIFGSALEEVGKVESVTLEIRNDRTRETALFTYFGSGFGGGLPASISLPSDWISFQTPAVITMDDFEGEASHWSAGAALYGYEEFTLWNPMVTGKTERGITLRKHGAKLQLGGGATHGHLERRDD